MALSAAAAAYSASINSYLSLTDAPLQSTPLLLSGEGEGGALPPGFAWSQRAKGVLQMPGGYGGYLTSLRKVCAVVAEERPAPLEPHEQRQQHAICADSLPVQPFTATRRRPKTGCETRM